MATLQDETAWTQTCVLHFGMPFASCGRTLTTTWMQHM